MKLSKKQLADIFKEDITEIDIELIKKKNAEFINLNRLFIQQSRKLTELKNSTEDDTERAL